jgi:hypothetical protein
MSIAGGNVEHDNVALNWPPPALYRFEHPFSYSAVNRLYYFKGEAGRAHNTGARFNRDDQRGTFVPCRLHFAAFQCRGR